MHERSAVGVKHADAVAVLIDHECPPSALVHRYGAGRLAHGDAAHEPPTHDVKDTHVPKATTVLAGDKDTAGPLVDGHALRQQPHGDGAHDGPAVGVQHTEAARPAVTSVADHERPPDPFVHRNGQGRQADANSALHGPTPRVKHCDATLPAWAAVQRQAQLILKTEVVIGNKDVPGPLVHGQGQRIAPDDHCAEERSSGRVEHTHAVAGVVEDEGAADPLVQRYRQGIPAHGNSAHRGAGIFPGHRHPDQERPRFFQRGQHAR